SKGRVAEEIARAPRGRARHRGDAVLQHPRNDRATVQGKAPNISSVSRHMPVPTARATARLRPLRVLLVLVTLLGALRAFALIAHAPLLAYANSYDEVRYTACFDLYPNRPSEIPPTDNSPWAPFSDYVFIARSGEPPMCYWSSELLPQALV